MQAHNEFCHAELTHRATGLGSLQNGNLQAGERQWGEFSLKACRALTHKQLVAQLKEWQRLSSLQAFHRQDGAFSCWRGPAAFPG